MLSSKRLYNVLNGEFDAGNHELYDRFEFKKSMQT